MADHRPERHWLGKGMLGAFSLAFTIGASYLLNANIAVALVLWAVLGVIAVLLFEVIHVRIRSDGRRTGGLTRITALVGSVPTITEPLQGEDVRLADIDLIPRQVELLKAMAFAGIGKTTEAFRCFASDLGHDEDSEGRPIFRALPNHNIFSNPQTYDIWHSGLTGRHRRAEKRDLEMLASYNLITLQSGEFGDLTAATLGRRALAYVSFLEGKETARPKRGRANPSASSKGDSQP